MEPVFRTQGKLLLLFALVFGSLLLGAIPLSLPSGSAAPEATLPAEPSAEKPSVFSLTGTDTVHLLLIGQDRNDVPAASRSDTVLLCTLRKNSSQLILTSFLRDLYVHLPGHGENRLNAAYALGGRELLCQTLQYNFGIAPDGVLEIDFSDFQETVDTLGGVTLTLRLDEAEAINKSTGGNLTEGTHLLSGREALAYVRIRKLDPDGDFSRTARQRKLLEAMLRSCRELRLGTVVSLAKDLIPLAKTDLSPGQLLRFALEALPMLPRLAVSGQQIPQADAYTYDTVEGMSVLIPDLDAARSFLQSTLTEQEP